MFIIGFILLGGGYWGIAASIQSAKNRQQAAAETQIRVEQKWQRKYELYKKMTGNPDNLSLENFRDMSDMIVVRYDGSDGKEVPCSTQGSSE